MFGALTSLTGGGGLTGGSAGPSGSGDAGSGMFGSSGGIAPVVVGGFKSDGSAAAGTVPGWFVPAAIGAALFLGWTFLRRR